jgi:hypothetical protein
MQNQAAHEASDLEAVFYIEGRATDTGTELD